MGLAAGRLGAEAVDQLLTAGGLVCDDQRHREWQAFLGQVDDDVLDRQPRGSLYTIDQISAQPARLGWRGGWR